MSATVHLSFTELTDAVHCGCVIFAAPVNNRRFSTPVNNV